MPQGERLGGEGGSPPPPPPPPDPASAPGSSRSTPLQMVLAELRAEYLEELPGKLQDLADSLEAARRDPGDAARQREARSQAHQLHGTAGSYGFSSMSAAAKRVEDTLAAIEAGEVAPTPAWAKIDDALADARAALAQARAAPAEAPRAPGLDEPQR